MPVVAPARYHTAPPRKKRRPYGRVALLVVAVAGVVNYTRPLPGPTVSWQLQTPKAETVQLAWPEDSTQAAVAAQGYGLLGTAGDSKPLATASMAKVLLALCVLQKQPLQPGTSGPTYTIGPADVANYDTEVSQGGSLLAVTLGDKLTEYEALQALMLPSANNIADSLATWVFGSHADYATYATAWLQQHGMNDTHIGIDASGFDASTTSTASDLTTLGLLALKNSVLMQIAGQRSAYIAGFGTVYNYDTILGVDGITGLKTGNNDANPGAFLFTSTARIGTQDIPLTGTVMGASSLDSALHGAVQLNDSLQRQFEQITVTTPGQKVGSMHTAWGARADIVADKLELVRWKATAVSQTHRLDTAKRSGTIGSLRVSAGPNHAQTELKLGTAVTGPTFWWRLTRH